MRHLVPALIAVVLAAHGPVAAKPTRLRTGSVGGTAFVLGPIPEDAPPLHVVGDTHPSDWTGGKNVDYYGLWDVVISVLPLNNPSAASASDPPSFPEPGALICQEECDSVTVATGDRLELWNFGDKPVLLNVVKDGRTRLRISIQASQVEPPAEMDISSLEAGVYELIDPSGKRERSLLYRAAVGEIVVGPTNGNCRYAITLTPGKYKVRAWHPFLPLVEKIVNVRARSATRMNPIFRIPKAK
jgi:hypothetical protein